MQFIYRALFFLIFLISANATASLQRQWETLPASPTLPKAEVSGYASINGIKLWYARFGKGQPVILLHGGLANANYWGYLVPVLAKEYQVIVIDNRGQGRSTNNNHAISYDLMASDVIAVMNYLKISKAAIVGWSDGANIGLTLAIHHPERLTKLFAFGANSNPSGIKESVATNPVMNAYIERAAKEYMALSPTPTKVAYNSLLEQLNKMWSTQPQFTSAQLHSITVPTWIVDGDHEEGINREDTEYMAKTIPNAGLLIEPEVSHFAFLQDPQQFNIAVLHFLEHAQ